MNILKTTMKKESSYLKYQDVNNLYGLVMSQRLPVNDLKLVEDISEFNKSFIKYYNKESDESFFLEVYFQYTDKLHDLYNDLPFLPERMKFEKLVTNLQSEYALHIN